MVRHDLTVLTIYSRLLDDCRLAHRILQELTWNQWMLPSQTRKASEVRIRGHHHAAMLDRRCRVLRVGYQLPTGP